MMFGIYTTGSDLHSLSTDRFFKSKVNSKVRKIYILRPNRDAGPQLQGLVPKWNNLKPEKSVTQLFRQFFLPNQPHIVLMQPTGGSYVLVIIWGGASWRQLWALGMEEELATLVLQIIGGTGPTPPPLPL